MHTMDSSLLYRELTSVYSKEGSIDMSNFPLSKLVDKKNGTSSGDIGAKPPEA
jgi:hypothetical protein